MNKNLIHISTAVVGFFSLTGCQNWLDVVPKSDIETIESQFEKREDAERWLLSCYSMIVYETSDVHRDPAYWGTDEVVLDDYTRITNTGKDSNDEDKAHKYLPGVYIADGLQMAQDPYGAVWKSDKFYGAIRYCNIFLEHIDKVYNMMDSEKRIWKAEVKALKAEYYFELFRRYGPFILVPENIDANSDIANMQQPRASVDECVNAIVELCDEAIPDLQYFKDQSSGHYTFFNKEAAATIKAMTLLYAASPLFNGNTALSRFTNKNGERLFPDYDKEKWKLAAQAADEALAICRTGGRKLESNYSTWSSPMLNKILDNQKACLDYSYKNTEALLRVRLQNNSPEKWYHPYISAEYQNYYDAYTEGGASASMKMVEMFYTEHGLPLDEDKQWMSSRYTMSKETDEQYRNIVPLGKDVLSLHRRREPRFYASIAAHGTYWYRKQNYGNTYEAVPINCLQGQMMGTTSKRYDSSIPQALSGYYIKKFDNPELPFYMYNNTLEERAHIIYRLPDLLLASAEAWNEYLDQPDERVYNPLDEIRVRAGVGKVKDAWETYARNPQKVNTQAGMREIIRQEWNIEFAFEGRRFFNLRRWMTAPSELNQPLYGWNITADTEQKFFNNYTAPMIVWKKRGFQAPRDYFFPIGSEEVMISGCKQNVGW